MSEDRPTVVIHFPRPPSANRMFLRQMTRKGKRRLSPEYTSWRDTAGWEVKMQIIGMKPIDTKFDVVIEVPIRSRVDVDNNLKPILDLAQNMGVITNDRNANRITISPADREDCMAAFYALPDMGGVRKPARKRMPTARKAKNKPGLTWKL